MATKIEKHVGNLLDVRQGIIVHGCNAQGEMGAGVALAVRRKYEGAYLVYRKAYEQNQLKVGRIVPYHATRDAGGTRLLIVNAITQEHYGTHKRQVDYEGVYQCFERVAKLARETGLHDIHFPLIGCGLAGGKWSIIAPIIEETLDGLNAHLWVLG